MKKKLKSKFTHISDPVEEKFNSNKFNLTSNGSNLPVPGNVQNSTSYYGPHNGQIDWTVLTMFRVSSQTDTAVFWADPCVEVMWV